MITGLITYYLFSIAVVTLFRHTLGELFYDDGTVNRVREHNKKLLVDYRNKKISAMKYRDGLMTVEKERKFKVYSYYFLAPIICPLILFWIGRDVYIFTSTIIKLWRDRIL